jgi:site-specific DNA-methyltransferase (adenine-specific)
LIADSWSWDAGLVCGDCLDVVAALPHACVDAVVADPPWNLAKDYGAHDDERPPDEYARWLATRLAACRRASRGPIALLPGDANLAGLPGVLAAAGLILERLLWWGLDPGDGAPVRWEPAVVARDPARRITGWNAAAGLGIHRVEPADGHPCPKPVALIARLVMLVAPPGALVLDPFAGLGSTLLAAGAVGRRAIGVELEPRFCAAAAARNRRIRPR